MLQYGSYGAPINSSGTEGVLSLAGAIEFLQECRQGDAKRPAPVLQLNDIQAAFSALALADERLCGVEPNRQVFLGQADAFPLATKQVQQQPVFL